MDRGKNARAGSRRRIVCKITAGVQAWSVLAVSRLSATKEVTVFVSNFFKMPGFLRFLTGVALLPILFVAQSVFSDFIRFQGSEIRRYEWWENGSGVIQLLSSLPMITAAFLMLARSRYARVSYVLGWLISDIGAGFILYANGLMRTDEAWWFLFSTSAISLIVFSCYVLASKRVAAYIRGESPQVDRDD